MLSIVPSAAINSRWTKLDEKGGPPQIVLGNTILGLNKNIKKEQAL
jgi:hypothetical protein